MSTTIACALQKAAALGMARIDAQLLLLHALGQPGAGRAWLIAHDGDVLAPAQQRAFATLCQRRLDGEPVAYLTGMKEFFGLPLHVDARVLDPRPDTETLVEWALALLPGDGSGLRIADLGTGSGAIALALQHALPQAQVWAVDVSADALAVAQANAARLRLPVRLACGHWLRGVAASARFDAIVTNPPYIREADPHLAALRHEPRQALVSGADGLDDIRQIVDAAPAHLRAGGWLLIEHGYDQAADVCALLAARGFVQVQSRRDLAGIGRASGGQWAGVE